MRLLKKILYACCEKNVNNRKININIDFNNSTYHYKAPTANLDFNNFIDAATPLDETTSKRLKLADAEKNQVEFKSKLSNIKQRAKNQPNRKMKFKLLRFFTIARWGYQI